MHPDRPIHEEPGGWSDASSRGTHGTPRHRSLSGGGLTKLTSFGARWTYTSLAASAVVQFVFIVVMSRVLTPRDFGLFAASMVVASFASHLGQSGVHSAVVQRSYLTDDDCQTAMVTSAGLGFVVLIGVSASATVVSSMLGQSGAEKVLVGISLMYLLNGVSAVPIGVMKRGFRFRALAGIEVAASVLGYLIIGIVSGLAGLGVWSLVLAALGYSAVEAALALRLTRWQFRVHWRWSEAWPLLRYGGLLSLAALLQQGAGTGLIVLFSRLFGPSALGQLNRTQALAQPLFAKVAAGLSKVLFPGFAAISRNRGRSTVGYLLSLQIVGGLLGPLAGAGAAAAEELVLLILGPGWSMSADLLPWLLAAIMLNTIAHFSGVVLDANGVLAPKIGLEVTHLLALVAAILVFGGYGAVPVVAAAAGMSLLRLMGYAHILARYVGIPLDKNASVLLPLTAAALATYLVVGLARYATIRILQGGRLWPVLLTESVSALVFILWLWTCGPLAPTRREVASRLLLVVRRPRIVRALQRAADTPR